MFAPVMLNAVIDKADEPTFVRVTFCVELVPTLMVPKFKLEGASSTTVAVQARDTVCGLPGALSVKLSVPVKLPFAVGLQAT